MKKIVSAILLLFVATFITGCGIDEKFIVSDSGKISVAATIYFTDEEKAQLLEEGMIAESDIKGTMDINGEKYYYVSVNEENYEADGAIIVNQEKFYMLSADATSRGTDSEMVDKIAFETISVTMPKKITNTNGKLSADKKTASWDFDAIKKNKELYAYTTTKPAENPVSIETKDAKYLKANIKYTINTKDSVTGVQIGERFIKPGEKGFIDGINISGKKIKFQTTGTYAFTIWTSTSKKSFELKVDGTSPVVIGIKNNKIYKKVIVKYSDKHSGIKKATLNGNKIKSGKIVSRSGKYKLLVTDKVGNTRTVKFKIKK